MKHKKGMEMSLNTVIIAVIVLIVLIVMVIVFTSALGKANKGMNECANKDGYKCGADGSKSNCIKAGGAPFFEIIKEDGTTNGWCCMAISGKDLTDCTHADELK